MNTRKITSLLKLTGITASVVLVAESCTQAWYTKGVEAWLLQDKNEFAIADSQKLEDIIEDLNSSKTQITKDEEKKIPVNVEVTEEILHKVAVTKFPNLTLDNEKVPAGHRFFWEPKLDKEATVTDAVAGDSFVTVATTSKLVKDKDTDKDATVYKYIQEDVEFGDVKKVKIKVMRVPILIQVGKYVEVEKKIVRDLTGVTLEGEYLFSIDHFVKSDDLEIDGTKKSPFDIIDDELHKKQSDYFSRTLMFGKDAADNTLPNDGERLDKNNLNRGFLKNFQEASAPRDGKLDKLEKKVDGYNKNDDNKFMVNMSWRKNYSQDDIYSVYEDSNASGGKKKNIVAATLKYDFDVRLKDLYTDDKGDYKIKAYNLTHTDLINMYAARKTT